MNKYLIRREFSDKVDGYPMSGKDHAGERAQYLADEHGDRVGVYVLDKTFIQTPKTVITPIDKVLDELKGRGDMGNHAYGVANALKKLGVESLEWPGKD